MKVKPYIKQQPLKENEIKIISIGENAIAELLLETLMQNKSKYFDVPKVSTDSICIMKWDKDRCFLTYAIMPIKYCLNGFDLNPKFIQEIGVTTDSLFKPNRYKVFTLTDSASQGRVLCPRPDELT